MEQHFTPPRYTWTATTAREAEDILDAAKKLISSHMTTLVPGDTRHRWKVEQSAPVALTVSLDLSSLIEQINDRRTLDGLESILGEDAA